MRQTGPTPNASNLDFVEGLYAAFLSDPSSVGDEWRAYFATFSNGGPPARVGPSFRPRTLFDPSDAGGTRAGSTARMRDSDPAALQDRLDRLVRSYRVRGHMIAEIDPLGRPRPHFHELDPEHYGFTESDLDRAFAASDVQGPPTLKLREILERLRTTYCRTIGVQFMHIDDPRKKFWLQERMEASQNHVVLSRDEQVRILTRLTDAVIFEEFVQKKFLGAKSFSLEGSESLIPLLDLAIERGAEQGVVEIVIGMAHRGRLNVLANIIGKHPRDIFREFADQDPELHKGSGDVKYHLGYSNEFTTSAGATVHLSLCFNPSHLEFVNPVALGRTRAKQDRHGDARRRKGMALLIHGDASFAGEGIVQETLNLSELRGYTTGGTLHVVVNNQIGFTTDPEDARSSVYATDVAKMLQIPIFHVNGEDPEAVAQVVQLAMDFRNEFGSDVVIDMYGYRRRGHNEGDEPAFTQPLLYQAIRARKPVREGYLDHLLRLRGMTREEADEIAVGRRDHLEQEFSAAKSPDYVHKVDPLGALWHGFHGGPDASSPEVATNLPRESLAKLLEALTVVPKGFTPHPKIAKWLESRQEMARGEKPLDWAAAEALALASLAAEGVRVRLTGQDTERGTFSHRHSALHDVTTGYVHRPLQHVAENQAAVEIWNSPLSETAVLGFEYGYTLDCPNGLVIWEAQFGDFVNVAQPILDQFLLSAEEKWKRLSGLVLLLPHGFEGQGPEHSSARLERFLTQAAEDNIQVVNLTTPAQFFHCLRRQVLRPWRKPLVVMSPKSLLRHPKVVSTLDELATGRFHRILPDPRHAADAKRGSVKVDRVLLCTGKIALELEERRASLAREDVALVRIEQLYPLSDDSLARVLAPYPDGTPCVWVQEEPQNMGARRYLRLRFGSSILGRYPFFEISREPSASPATGSASSHKLEQEEILSRALGPLEKITQAR
ncbi:MAG TPA: 2-oxoglutarate dehydrogenase E1 component [Planctomycetota bacterium]|jgi:2-oxoglutarate dehydrogenase E1 component|nr:2-oxoglutarate dehydrogenase E1 component [Planctomycetota bacterium]